MPTMSGGGGSVGSNSVGTAQLNLSTAVETFLDAANAAAMLSALGTGTPGATNFLRGDGSWATAGNWIQCVASIDGVTASGTTTIPLDDTIPQSGEGTQFYSVSITPTNSNNKLLILANLTAYPSASVNASAALFQDATANAIASSNPAYLGGGTWEVLHIMHTMTAGTTSATTFKLRAGPSTAATIYVNGNNSGRLFGGACRSGILVIEVAT